MKKLHLLFTLLLVSCFGSVAYGQHSHAGHQPDSAIVAHTAAQFHEALAAGDSLAVANLLAKDVRILESGGIETREEYLSHHFHSDAVFLAAMTRETGQTETSIKGDIAWIASKSRMHGTYKERAIDLSSAELMLLRKTTEGWRIAAIHWSSGNR